MRFFSDLMCLGAKLGAAVALAAANYERTSVLDSDFGKGCCVDFPDTSWLAAFGPEQATFNTQQRQDTTGSR